MHQDGTLIWGVVGILTVLALGSAAWAGDRKGRPGNVGLEDPAIIRPGQRPGTAASGGISGRNSGGARPRAARSLIRP